MILWSLDRQQQASKSHQRDNTEIYETTRAMKCRNILLINWSVLIIVLFLKLIEYLKGTIYSNDTNVITEVSHWLEQQPQEFPSRHIASIGTSMDYVEK